MANGIPAQKTCSKCGEAKPLDCFDKNRQSKDGRFSHCKECRSEYRAANRERIRAYNAEWRAQNADYFAEYRAANAQRRSDYSRRWRQANLERARIVSRAWYQANKEQKLEKGRAWFQANPERRREFTLRRLARKRAATVGVIDLDALWVQQGGICPLCGLEIDKSLMGPDPLSKSLDHILPLSKGGAHSQDNVQWTHLRCNLMKGATVPS